MNLFARKSMADLQAEANAEGAGTLKRHLGAGNLVLLGIGAIIGAGLFVRTAAAAAQNAGPSVTISFIIAAIGCALAGMCYAEFSAMTPVSGSAYTYAYSTMGELFAWIIGWDLVLEYALGAATVAIAWSQYLNKLIENFLGDKYVVPYQFCHSPFEVSKSGVHGIINLPAVLILLLLTFVLVRGIKESAVFNAIVVSVKVVIVLLFHWARLAVHQSCKSRPLDSTTRRVQRTCLRRDLGDSRRSRCGLLRLHWIRCRFHRGSRNQEPQARHADRDSWFACRMYGPLYFV